MTRSELHALVWRVPVRKLAPLLGMSTFGLSKLCRRHGIPLPGRAHWSKLAAGKPSTQTPLPPRDHDETIPRFRAIDGSGEPLEADEVEWVIPGVLAAAPPAPPPVNVEGLRAALSAGAPSSAPHAPPRRRPARARADEGRASPSTPSAGDRAVGASGFDDRAAAMEAELERAALAASEHHRHKATLELLNAVAMRAIDEEPASAQAILAWVAALRSGIESEDPVMRLVAALRSDGSSRLMRARPRRAR